MTNEAPLSAQIDRLRSLLDSADAVIVGAGAGLSAAAGMQYDGEFFQTYMGDFARQYGIRDMYVGGFYPFPTQEAKWAWWSRHIMLHRYGPIPNDTYDLLLDLVKGKDYFVLTTNVDHCFQRVGFDKARLFYTQGDYGLWQCSLPCHQKTYDNEDRVRAMVESQGWHIGPDGSLEAPAIGTIAMTVPSDLVPVCPRCGEPMTMNLRADNTFVEDRGWHAAAARYADFLTAHGIAPAGFFTSDGRLAPSQDYEGRVVFLELGVGGNTPGIIKYPFWQMTYQNDQASYACLNMGQAGCPSDIADRAVCINGDIRRVLEALCR
jgi:NAD-dependent SIR2 family protein deacetylase